MEENHLWRIESLAMRTGSFYVLWRTARQAWSKGSSSVEPQVNSDVRTHF